MTGHTPPTPIQYENIFDEEYDYPWLSRTSTPENVSHHLSLSHVLQYLLFQDLHRTVVELQKDMAKMKKQIIDLKKELKRQGKKVRIFSYLP